MADKAEQALRMVREAKLISYDTETSGLDWKRNFAVGYVVAVDGLSVYVPVRHGGGGNLPDRDVRAPELADGPTQSHKFERALAKAFTERQRLGYRTVGHHVKFDAHFSANSGVMLGRNLCCTQNNEALLNEHAWSFSLDASAERRGVQAKLGDDLYRHLAEQFGCKPDRSSMGNFWRLSGDDPLGVEYAEGDGITTLELYQKQLEQIEEEELGTVFQLENDLIWTLFKIERRGIKVDTGYLEETKEALKVRVQEALDRMPDNFNVRSPIQVKKYVEDAGHTDWPKTDKGNPSFKESWLKKFPEGQNIVEIRKWTNLLNSFITPLLESHVFEGRVHAGLNQLKSDDLGTAARLSCSNPNLQAIPKRDKELAALFRTAFLADEGYEFNEADWSQCEPRLFAHYSKEPKLLDGYNQEPFEDVHQIVANMLKVDRAVTAKRMNMGIFTGMYPKTFSEHMNWPLDKAAEAWTEWHSTFPAIMEFQNAAKAVIMRRGFVKSLLGRRLRLDHPRFAYRATSKVIQSGNADIIKYKMLELDKMFENDEDLVQLLMSVHDSIEWQSEDSDRGKEASKAILAVMVDVQAEPFNLRVPFAVDHMSGKTWKDATFGGDD